MDETITVRLPETLKKSVELAAQSRGMTLAGWVKKALEESLQPPYRVVQIPGMDPAFDQFLERVKAESKASGTPARALILVDEGNGNRYVARGLIDFRKTSETIVGLTVGTAQSIVLLRHTVVGWYDADREVGPILTALEARGWRVVPARAR